MLAWTLITLVWSLFDPSPVGKCDPVDGPKLEWSREDRQEARETATARLRERGARPVFLAYLDAVGERETHWTASRWHDEGTGLGMHGMNVQYHARGRNLCDPRMSADAVQEVARRAIVRHGASNAYEIQAVFAGRMECAGRTQKKVCTGEQQDRTYAAICPYMQRRGFSCFAKIGLGDIGHDR